MAKKFGGEIILRFYHVKGIGEQLKKSLSQYSTLNAEPGTFERLKPKSDRLRSSSGLPSCQGERGGQFGKFN